MSRPNSMRAALIVTLVLAAGTMGACSSSGSSNGASSSTAVPAAGSTVDAPPLASASLGPLSISGGYIPAPASPDVAAAYLTITNQGDRADRLTKVTSSATKTVMPMTETDSGGVGSMTDLGTVTVPAHGRMQFVPDHAHLMLENPKPLKAGDHVLLSLTFSPAGTVSITLPVLPLDEVPVPAESPTSGTSGSGSSPMPGMGSGSPMPGMSMPGMSMPG